jgi:hypothetical protein
MLFTVVASGQSAEHWERRGTCIGSNDCEKWGKPVDILILANSPHKFKERLNIIKKSKAKVLVTNVNAWKPIFPNCERIQRLTAFNINVRKGFIYSSSTTPIICLSMAISLGASQIVMWGNDLVNHHAYRVGTKAGDHEINKYIKFFRACEKVGIKIYLGSLGTAFDKTLPLWKD